MFELLSTKLFIPRPRKNLVSRLRLVERLNAGLEKKLTLIAAPAGFGKTTLLSEWIPQSPRCVTWLSLDEADNDSTRFWIYFISSLQGLHPDFGKGALALLQSTLVPPISSILTTLINEITAFPDWFALVLDDYHVIDAQQIHEALIFLIDHLPANMHLVMTTRVDPPLPLARLRVRDQLTEIRVKHLRFTRVEAESFLNQEVGERFTQEEVAVLEERTEGWIAGLQIAALSMQGHEDISGFVQVFSGGHRHILGYLADEVLNQRPKGTLNFLLQTAILDRLCGPLCDAVTEGSNGQEILESLEHANLFIMPLDNDCRWYRYHHLFAEVLRAQLKQSQGNQIPDLHQRASGWLEQNGLIPEAVGHSFAAQDFENAARLIETVAMAQFGQPVIQHSLKTWLAALPEKATNSRPLMFLVHAWQSFVQLDMPAASRHVDVAEQVLQQIRFELEEDRNRNLTGSIAAMRALTNAFKPAPDLDQVLASADVALADLDPDEFNFRGFAAGAAGSAYLKRGELVQAERMFTEAVENGRAAGNIYMLGASTDNLTQVMRVQGNWHQAIALCREILEGISENREKTFPPTGMIYYSLADLLREMNGLEEARHYAEESIILTDSSVNPGHTIFSHFVLAHIKQAQQDWDGALEDLAKVSSWMQQQPGMWNLDIIPSAEAQLQAMRGDLEQAFQWAMATGWPEDPWGQFSTTWELIWQHEHLQIARAQIFIAYGQKTGNHKLIQEAEAYLNRQQVLAEENGLEWYRIKLLILRSLCRKYLEESEQAMNLLERALLLAKPEFYVRVFVDEGETMYSMLLDYQRMLEKRSDVGRPAHLLTYIDRLLAAFLQPSSKEKTKQETFFEPLSEREREILRLIAQGCTNQQIADLLVIALSTVKSHINNLYGKLGTNRRTEAIVIAREKGLLSD